MSDNGGGKISGLRYDSMDPLSHKLSEFPFQIGDKEPLSGTLDQLKGARVELKFGAETVAAALGEERDVIEDVIEPYLVQQGFVQRTPRGRLVTVHGFRHLGLPEPSRDVAQFGLFAAGEDD